jgi:hypothetical protein
MEQDHLSITMLDRLGALADHSAPRFEIGPVSQAVKSYRAGFPTTSEIQAA